MMNFRKGLSKVLLIGMMGILLSGCTIPFLGGAEGDDKTSEQTSKSDVLPKSEDDSMKAVISEYLTSLYGISLKDCLGYTQNGAIPAEIKKYVSSETIRLAEGNPEIGLHYPKIVYMNGLLTGNFEVLKCKDPSGKEVPEIIASCVKNDTGVFTYFVKLNLKAKCIKTNEINSFLIKDVDPAVTLQMATFDQEGKESEASILAQQAVRDKTMKLIDDKGSAEYPLETIKLQAQYNFTLKKEGNSYKVLTAKEAKEVDGYVNRLSIFNNSSMQRTPYLSIDKNQIGTILVNQEDVKTFEREKSFILTLFNDLRLNLNSENVKLLESNEQIGIDKFRDFLGKISVNKSKDSKGLLEMMDIGPDYLSKFNSDSLPIQTNMEMIKGEYANFIVTQHPSYSDQQKRYMVSFEAPVETINGMVEGKPKQFKYNYEITLTGEGDALKISSIKLNEYYQK